MARPYSMTRRVEGQEVGVMGPRLSSPRADAVSGSAVRVGVDVGGDFDAAEDDGADDARSNRTIMTCSFRLLVRWPCAALALSPSQVGARARRPSRGGEASLIAAAWAFAARPRASSRRSARSMDNRSGAPGAPAGKARDPAGYAGPPGGEKRSGVQSSSTPPSRQAGAAEASTLRARSSSAMRAPAPASARAIAVPPSRARSRKRSGTPSPAPCAARTRRPIATCKRRRRTRRASRRRSPPRGRVHRLPRAARRGSHVDEPRREVERDDEREVVAAASRAARRREHAAAGDESVATPKTARRRTPAGATPAARIDRVSGAHSVRVGRMLVRRPRPIGFDRARARRPEGSA